MKPSLSILACCAVVTLLIALNGNGAPPDRGEYHIVQGHLTAQTEGHPSEVIEVTMAVTIGQYDPATMHYKSAGRIAVTYANGMTLDYEPIDVKIGPNGIAFAGQRGEPGPSPLPNLVSFVIDPSHLESFQFGRSSPFPGPLPFTITSGRLIVR